MAKIEINNVYKIFGNTPSEVLPMVKEGATKEEVLDKAGHTVGLDNVTISTSAKTSRILEYDKANDEINPVFVDIDNSVLKFSENIW